MAQFGQDQEEDEVSQSGSQFGTGDDYMGQVSDPIQVWSIKSVTDEAKYLSLHLPGCPTPRAHLDLCRYCFAGNSPPALQLFAQQARPSQSPIQEHPRGDTPAQTYVQVASARFQSPPAAPAPSADPPLPRRSARLRHESTRRSESPRPDRVPIVREPRVQQPPGPYSYAEATQQYPTTRPFNGGSMPAQNTAWSNTTSQRLTEWGEESALQYSYTTTNAQLLSQAESSTQAQRRQYAMQQQQAQQQCFMARQREQHTYQQQHLMARQREQHAYQQQHERPPVGLLHPAIAVRSNYSAPQVVGASSSLSEWNRQPRVAGDWTSALTATESPVDPTTPVQSQGSPTERSSGSRRSRDQMYDPSLPYMCDTCRRTYRTQADHNHHVQRTHADRANRPHVCPHCASTFNHPRELERHIAGPHRNLIGAPRHYCRYSGCHYATQGFARSDQRNRHERTVHGEVTSQPMSHSSSSQTWNDN